MPARAPAVHKEAYELSAAHGVRVSEGAHGVWGGVRGNERVEPREATTEAAREAAA